MPNITMETIAPHTQFDELIGKLIKQGGAMPQDVDDLIAHVARMRLALVPFTKLALVLPPNSELTFDGVVSVTVSYDDVLAALTAYDDPLITINANHNNGNGLGQSG